MQYLSPVELALSLRPSVLLDPPQNSGADSLLIVVGYASPGFAKDHLDTLSSICDHEIKISLLLGMRTGLDWAKREELLNLEHLYDGRFEVFVNEGIDVHTKHYAWFVGDAPVVGFSGSANYSLNGFPKGMRTCRQLNDLRLDDPERIRFYFEQTPKVRIEDATVRRPLAKAHSGDSDEAPPGGIRWLNREKTKVRISFLSADGTLKPASGLNWEMPNGSPRRPFHDNPVDRWRYDAAYLRVPKRLHRENPGFFPEKDSFLTLLTDDGQYFYCAIQQQDRKAISTTSERSGNSSQLGNRQLGGYLRDRLGVVSGDRHPLRGEHITKSDLERYGRLDYTIEKVSDESYLFDFSSG